MITKRSHNASLIRFRVLDYLLKECRTRDFKSVHVSEICAASGISKVTFFKYFDQKEDVLMLFHSIINTRICIEVSEKDIHSIAGLEAIIDQYVSVIRDTPSLAREITSTLLHLRLPILPVILTESDKALFFPKTAFENVSQLSFWDLVESFMLEGILGNDITKMASAAELTTIFMSVLYGAIITSHIKGGGMEPALFNNIIRTWLKNI